MPTAPRRSPATALLAIAVLVSGGGGPLETRRHDLPEPRRIVLFVADGAGVATWSAALHAADSLAIQEFPVLGLVDPRNTSRPTPESASSATAFATGVRTYYRAVGVGPDSLPRTTVLEAAEREGLSTGLVTTTLLTDATPAAFAAHVPNRDQRFEIARQMAAQGIEVLLGDGREAFDPATRPDSLNLVAQLRRDHAWVETAAQLAPAAEADSVLGLVGFFALDSVSRAADRRPSLGELTGAALRVLDRDPDGFFLLVETEHTDHFGHRNRPLPDLVAEVLHLDEAIRVATAYRRAHPETLIVVVGDHETGGLDLIPDSTGALAALWSTTNHTAEMIPLFAIGPGAERLRGIYAAEHIGRTLLDAVTGRDRLAPAFLTPDRREPWTR